MCHEGESCGRPALRGAEERGFANGPNAVLRPQLKGSRGVRAGRRRRLALIPILMLTRPCSRSCSEGTGVRRNEYGAGQVRARDGTGAEARAGEEPGRKSARPRASASARAGGKGARERPRERGPALPRAAWPPDGQAPSAAPAYASRVRTPVNGCGIIKRDAHLPNELT